MTSVFLFGSNNALLTAHNVPVEKSSEAPTRKRVFPESIVDRKVHKFFVTTRRGKVMKTVREHYLRSDVYCGLNECKQCKRGYATSTLELLDNASISSLINGKHLLILDTETVLHNGDALEDPLFDNAIVLHTGWEEVRRRSGAAYKRLHDQVFARQAAWYIFDNEHQPDCYVEHDEAKRSSEQRDRELVHAAAIWYQKHCKEVYGDKCVDALLLCDDEGARDAAVTAGVTALTLRQYVESLTTPKPDLLDRIGQHQARRDDPDRITIGTGRTLFDAHLSARQIADGLASGKLRRGNLQMSRDNYLEAYVYADGDADEPVLIQGLLNINRAVNGDTVAHEW